MKECLTCKKQVEDLRHTCPFCGKENFMAAGAREEVVTMLDAKQNQIESAKHVDLGARFLMDGHYADAESEFRIAIKLNPLNATGHGNLGGVFFRQGLFTEAIPWLEKALEINPHLSGVPEALEQARKNGK